MIGVKESYEMEPLGTDEWTPFYWPFTFSGEQSKC